MAKMNENILFQGKIGKKFQRKNRNIWHFPPKWLKLDDIYGLYFLRVCNG